ncbi:MAG: hypothetical protein EAZ95_10505 [Bacteroidetes bacterium]|nr:MAG: hypothetical protein EAZ95_10505 [Bacteroidota bacterium]
MAYKDFKLEDIQTMLGISNFKHAFVPKGLPTFSPTAHLLQELSEASKEALYTEKAKLELIITPIIKELKRQNPDKFSFFSGYEFNVDSKLSLKGYCDFLLSTVANTFTIQAPVFCLVVKGKKDSIYDGFGQCASEMYATQLFNERQQRPQKRIFGCVTNAFTWAFLVLEGKNLYIDTHFIPLTFDEPHRVLAVLQWILDSALANV